MVNHRSIYQQQLERFVGYEEEFHASKTPPTEKQMYPYMTLRRSVIASESWIAWADEVLVLFHELDKAP